VLAEVSTESSDIGVTAFSALSRLGLPDVAETLHGWVRPGLAPDATPDAATDSPA
jgi:GTP-binding protein